MKRILCLTLTYAPVLTSLGCSSYSIRPGIWEMSFHQVERADTGAPLAIPSRLARVVVEARAEPDTLKPEVIEVAEIFYVGSASGGESGERAPVGPKSLFAEISAHGEQEKVFQVLPKRRDEDWTFILVGVIVDPETIRGTRLDAKINEQSTVPFHGGPGSWSMRWIRDE